MSNDPTTPGHDPRLTQPIPPGSPTRSVPAHPPAPWQPPPPAPEVPFGPAARWALWINIGLALLLAIGVYLLAALVLNLFGQFSEAYGGDNAAELRDSMWVWSLVPAAVTLVGTAVWGTLTSVLCLALLRLSAGFRRIGAGGQGALAWLTAIVASSVVGGLASTVLSFSGESIARLLER